MVTAAVEPLQTVEGADHDGTEADGCIPISTGSDAFVKIPGDPLEVTCSLTFTVVPEAVPFQLIVMLLVPAPETIDPAPDGVIDHV